MLHGKGTGMAEGLVPDSVGRPQRAAGVACCRLYVEIPEGRSLKHLAVRHAVVAATAGQTQSWHSRLLEESVGEREVCLLEHRLDRCRQILVPLLDRIRRTSGRSEG